MSKTVNFSKNDIIFKEGDSGNCMYMVLGDENAKVSVYANFGTNREVVLGTLRINDYFGEMALLGKHIRTATVVATTPVTLEVIEEADFKDFTVSHPGILKDIIHDATGRLRKLTRDYTNACNVAARYVEAKERGEEIPKDIIVAMDKFV